MGFPRGSKVDGRRTLFCPSGDLDDEKGATLEFGIDQAYQPELPSEDWRGFSGSAIVSAETPDSETVWIYGVAQHVPAHFTRRLGVSRLAQAFESPSFRETLFRAGGREEPPTDPVVSFATPQPFLRTPTIRGSQFYFGTRFNQFIGRDETLKDLRRFTNSEARFQWWLLYGKAGSGKSRAALEFGLELDGRWHWGFLHDQSNVDWSIWQPFKPTFLVVDYAAYSAGQCNRLVESLALRQTSLRCKVRILLLERTNKGKWFDNFRGSGSSQEAVDSSACSLEGLELDGLREINFWRVFTQFADRDVGSEEQLVLLPLLKKLDPEQRPLFAALAGSAVAKGRDIRKWDQTALLNFHRREMERTWNPAGARKMDKALLAFATIVQGIDSSELSLINLPQYLPDAASFDPHIYCALSGAESNSRLAPLEPDILGEYFVLEYLKPTIFGAPMAKDFAKAIWPSDTFSYRAFSFISRSIDDFPEHPTLQALLESPVDALSHFWQGAFTTYVGRRAMSHLDEAYKLFDSVRPLYAGKSLPVLTWLGRLELSQALLLSSLSQGNFDLAMKLYAEVEAIAGKVGHLVLFSEYKPICSWAMSDFCLDRGDIKLAVNYFADLVGCLSKATSTFGYTTLPSKCGLLAMRLEVAILALPSDDKSHAEQIANMNRQLGLLLGKNNPGCDFSSCQEIVTAWWATASQSMRFKIASSDFVDIRNEIIEISRESVPVDRTPDPNRTAAIIAKCQAEIIDVASAALLTRCLTTGDHEILKEEKEALAENAIAVRNKSHQALVECNFDITTKEETFWCDALLQTSHSLVRLCTMTHQMECVESARTILAPLVSLLSETDGDEERSRRLPDASATCIAGYAFVIDIANTLRVAEELFSFPQYRVSHTETFYLCFVVGSLIRHLRGSEDEQKIVSCGERLLDHFQSSGTFTSFTSSSGITEEEAHQTCRSLLFD